MKRIAFLFILLSVSLLTRSYLLKQRYAYVLTALVYALLLTWVLTSSDTELLNARAPLYAMLVIFLLYFAHTLLSAINGQGILTSVLRSTVFVGFAAVNLFVLPNYFSSREFMRVVSSFSVVVVAIGLPAAILGNYSVLGITVQAWPWQLPFTPAFLPDDLLYPVQSVANNPNIVGLLAAIGTICSTAMLSHRYTRLAWATLVCNLLGVILSGSRAAFLATAVGGSMLLIWHAQDVRTLRFMTALGVVGWGVFIGLVAGILPFHEVVSSINLRGRTVLWRGAVDAISTRPVFGFGPGDRAVFIRPFIAEEWYGHTPHNSYLRMYLTTGIMGGMAYVYFTLTAIFGAIREDVPPETVTLAIVAVVAAILQTFAGFSLFGLSFNSVLIALVFGFAAHPNGQLSDRVSSS